MLTGRSIIETLEAAGLTPKDLYGLALALDQQEQADDPPQAWEFLQDSADADRQDGDEFADEFADEFVGDCYDAAFDWGTLLWGEQP